MVNKSKSSVKEQQKGKVKVGKLKVNKETIKELSSKDARKVRGGIQPDNPAGRAVKDTVGCF